MGTISTSAELDKTWHGARWGFRRFMEDATRLHGRDPELGPLFQQTIFMDGLSFEMVEDSLVERAMAALIETAKTTLEPSARNLLQWHVGLGEEAQRSYLEGIAELLDLLEREKGKEPVGVISISDDKSWVVARWCFLRFSKTRCGFTGRSRGWHTS